MHKPPDRPVAAETRQELFRWLSGVHSFITAVNRPASLRELLDLVTATACDLLGYDFCGVLLVEPQQRRLLLQGAHGLTSEYVDGLNAHVPISLASDAKDDSPSTVAFRTRRPVVVNNVAEDPLMRPWLSLAQQQGYRSIVSVPLLLQDRAIGVLNGYCAVTDGIGPSSIELLGILAQQAAAAIESIHLRDERQAYIDRLAEANASLRRQRELLQQAETIHTRLNDVALGAGGLGDIGAALADVLGRDVLIDDVFGTPIAGPTSDPSRLRDITRHAPDEIADLQALRTTDGVDVTVAPIRVAGDVVARVWVDAPVHELGGLDMRAVESARVIIALELLRQRAALDVEWRVQGDIINVLASGQVDDHQTLVSRARALGHDLSVPHRVIAWDVKNSAGQSALHKPHLGRAIKECVRAQFASSGPRPLIGVHADQLFALVPGRDPGEALVAPTERVRHQIAHRFGLTVSAFIGPTAATLPAYPRAFRIVRGASAVHLRREGAAETTCVSGMGLAGLLLQVDSPEELTQYSATMLQPLRDHDAARSSALEETLRRYFDRECSVSEAAADLFLHPNTVKMRLKKAEALLGINLARPVDALNIRVALMIDDIGAVTDTLR